MARRKGRSLVPLKFQTQVSLLTLASNTALSVVTVDSLEQDFDIVSTHMTLALRDMTDGQGPLDVGLAEQGYSDSEIVENQDASPLSQYGPAWERSNRKIRLYGTFSGEGAERVLNDGLAIKRKLFLKAFGHSTFGAAQVWIINRSAAPLTTGGALEVTGVHWGRWK